MSKNYQKSQQLTEEAFGKKNGERTNSAVVTKIGDSFTSAGVRDITKPESQENEITADTMFGEGSIGKVRFAGLAYMMQQERMIDLKQNAREFFSDHKVGEFLSKRHNDPKLQAAILNLFTQGSEQATLLDLLTHHSGIGDTTRDTQEMAKTRGILHNFTLSDLVHPQEESVVPRVDGKPASQRAPNIANADLPKGKYGTHEYSNLGYQIMAAAMEAAYFLATGKEKTYQQLLNDFMLHPIEGRAVGKGLEFNHTKFPQDISPDDDVVESRWIEKDRDGNDVMINPNNFNGANAGGGLFSSANDSTKFFTEFFRGFPGTKEYGKENANSFFSKETIEMMQKEWQSHSPANQSDIDKANSEGRTPPHQRFQGPGFTVDIDEKGNPVSYGKGGGTFGFISNMTFDPKAGEASISMIAQENVTSQKSKSWVEKVGGSHQQSQSFVEQVQSAAKGNNQNEHQ